jgi:DNA polymerase III epsilon subunit-like protein
MKNLIVVDVESDGPLQGINSMVCFGAVIVEEGLERTFYGKLKPVSSEYNPEALAISGFSREEHENFDDPKEVMENFEKWLLENTNGKPILISDNNGYDAAWINWYFHRYLGRNPFGWSSRRIGDIYCGFKNDMRASWKQLRDTKHTHNPVDDAKGNAEAILKMREMGLKIIK